MWISGDIQILDTLRKRLYQKVNSAMPKNALTYSPHFERLVAMYRKLGVISNSIARWGQGCSAFNTKTLQFKPNPIK